jgi:G6PDH family F420-dependent oxidoreductase
MAEYGFTLSGEEHPPERLVELAERAEEAGFDFVMMSDHYHPWTARQGESPFVWAVLGAVARATSRVRVGTGVTCPLIRIHPAIIAQAAATTARLFGDRFLLGLGSGENLNEHVVGAPWPPPEARLEMLEEAIGVLRRLWEGEEVTHRGRHYTVDEALLFTLPERPPPILVAAGGKKSAALAARCGDGMVGVAPERELLDTFAKAGGRDKPRFGQMTVCWGRDEKDARATALEFWPNSGLTGNVPWEVKTTALFDDVCTLVREEDIESVTCGPDVGRFVESVRRYEKAGYDHVWIHQVGPDQEGFLAFAERELLPKLR